MALQGEKERSIILVGPGRQVKAICLCSSMRGLAVSSRQPHQFGAEGTVAGLAVGMAGQQLRRLPKTKSSRFR